MHGNSAPNFNYGLTCSGTLNAGSQTIQTTGTLQVGTINSGGNSAPNFNCGLNVDSNKNISCGSINANGQTIQTSGTMQAGTMQVGTINSGGNGPPNFNYGLNVDSTKNLSCGPINANGQTIQTSGWLLGQNIGAGNSQTGGSGVVWTQELHVNTIYGQGGTSSSCVDFIVIRQITPPSNNQGSIGTNNTAFASIYGQNIYSANGTIQASDSILKDFVPLEYGLTSLLQIDTIKYKWNNLDIDDPNKDYEYYGVKADQLVDIFPELIYTETPIHQINYSELIPICINAIKDLKSLIDIQNSKIEQLEKKLRM